MSAPKRLSRASNTAGYPTLAETKLERRAFLVGAGAVAATAIGCGGLFPDSVSGGAPVGPEPDASTTSGVPDAGSHPPDASFPNDLSGGAPAEEQPDGGKPPDVP